MAVRCSRFSTASCHPAHRAAPGRRGDAINVGELATLRASINFIGRFSMEVGIRVDVEHIRSRAHHHTNSSYFTMAAVGENGRHAKVPAFVPATQIEEQCKRAAKLQRVLRREFGRDWIRCRSRGGLTGGRAVIGAKTPSQLRLS